ncbi:UbiD family decarboxylase [Rugosimonospora acidiphila]|uniref:UbiD family decarboxylase n=1 Tax=Rugosimonospora acidiphila TaxID=556531 RepID=A0ABP9RMV5_9ACTN
MSRYDLREWLDEADAAGLLTRLAGADRDLEIGAASQLNYRRATPRALLFDDIPGYPRGTRVLTSSLSGPALLGLALNLGADNSDADLVNTLRGRPSRWLAAAAEFTPTEVGAGPVFDTVLREDINLERIPAPLWHEGDGGRYIGTGCAVITRDHDTGVINLGAYRMQVQDGGAGATINIEQGKHGAQHIRRWFERQGRAPVAVSLGHHPVFLVVAGTEVPLGTSELNYAGAIGGAPVEVVRGEATGLPIPATSEIAIEGWLYPDQTRPEGPFGEWTGYYSGGVTPAPFLRPERFYARRDPILLGAPPGKPPHDYSYMRSVMKSAMITDALVDAGLPGVAGVWAHEAGGGRSIVIVAIEQAYAGHSRQAGYLAAQHPSAAYMNRIVITVDADINPRRLDEVMWAASTRCDPGTDIEIMRRTWGSRVDPLYTGGPRYNSRVLIDACRPYERLDDFPPVAEASPQSLRAAAQRWPQLDA